MDEAATLSVVMGNKREEEEEGKEGGCKLKRTPTVLTLLLLLRFVILRFHFFQIITNNLGLANSVSLTSLHD